MKPDPPPPPAALPQAYGQQEPEASAFGDCDAFTPLREALPQLWALWELLLLGEPLMVAAPSPGKHVGVSVRGCGLLLCLVTPWATRWRAWPRPGSAGALWLNARSARKLERLATVTSILRLLPADPSIHPIPAAGACSAAVAALLSLLAPFPYSLDWRPYFTIHDPAFARLAAGELPTAANALPMCMGVTNLYFLKVGRKAGGACRA